MQTIRLLQPKKVTRLLKNNVREMTAADAEEIYRAAYARVSIDNKI